MTQKITAALLATTLLGGCSMAPAYHVPAQLTPLPANFKAEPGWAQAAPADTAPKGDWWKLFGDPTLDALEAKVAVTNQNVAQARAAWMQARAAVAVDRAAQLPSAGISAGASHSRSQTGAGPAVGNSFNVGAWASWGTPPRRPKPMHRPARAISRTPRCPRRRRWPTTTSPCARWTPKRRCWTPPSPPTRRR